MGKSISDLTVEDLCSFQDADQAWAAMGYGFAAISFGFLFWCLF